MNRATAPPAQWFSSFDDLDEAAYRDLWEACGAPAFYHPGFLRAAELVELLPIEGTRYIAVLDHGRMLAFMVVYLQREPDPFGTLARTTGLRFDRGCGLLGHIAHCYESTILVRDDSLALRAAVLETVARLARQMNIPIHGLSNVDDHRLLAAAQTQGLAVKYMHDRFYIELSRYQDFEDFVARLPRDGRQEMNRQLRKFAASGATASVEELPCGDLPEVVRLCHDTTRRNGTPQYYPEQAFRRFVETCGDLIRVISIRDAGQIVGAAVCLREPARLHLWAGGVVYERSEFSPYTMLFATGLQYSFDRRIPVLEAGRTNAKIKGRLGCVPRKLYSMIAMIAGQPGELGEAAVPLES